MVITLTWLLWGLIITRVAMKRSGRPPCDPPGARPTLVPCRLGVAMLGMLDGLYISAEWDVRAGWAVTHEPWKRWPARCTKLLQLMLHRYTHAALEMLDAWIMIRESWDCWPARCTAQLTSWVLYSRQGPQCWYLWLAGCAAGTQNAEPP